MKTHRILMSIFCILCIFYIALCMSMLIKSPEEKEIDSNYDIIQTKAFYTTPSKIGFCIDGEVYSAYSDREEDEEATYEVVLDKTDDEIKVIRYEKIY